MLSLCRYYTSGTYPPSFNFQTLNPKPKCSRRKLRAIPGRRATGRIRHGAGRRQHPENPMNSCGSNALNRLRQAFPYGPCDNCSSRRLQLEMSGTFDKQSQPTAKSGRQPKMAEQSPTRMAQTLSCETTLVQVTARALLAWPHFCACDSVLECRIPQTICLGESSLNFRS